jgi:nucleoside 2-deoxyribosyltransferase
MVACERNERALVYLAAPLFSAAERDFNVSVANVLRSHWEVFLPQEDGGLMSDLIARGVPPKEASRQIFACDVAAIEKCTLLLAVLDGRAIDEGVAVELGYAYARGKPCYGLQTDVRRLVDGMNNPMIDGVLRSVIPTVGELGAWLESMARRASSLAH